MILRLCLPRKIMWKFVIRRPVKIIDCVSSFYFTGEKESGVVILLKLSTFVVMRFFKN